MGGEIPYVVMFQAVRRLSPTVADCWGFQHPWFEWEGQKKGDTRMSKRYTLNNGHNVWSAEMVFDIPEKGVLHGFAGYFEAVLYDTVGLSIHPDHKEVASKDMLSWFPLFFPIRRGIRKGKLEDRDADAVETVVHGRAETGGAKIKTGQTGLHNVSGRSSWIGL
ncbi:PRMT5-domain-containing protein [Armillaria gallica]|uniref:PRMT5-domain-containing protein n=1 Tax=Armillaria gallica TaxID=47427 RepID=A0A2H3E8E2_ARMGA|nr:PRMT5-domain-containing protein [Armillaria gallica]